MNEFFTTPQAIAAVVAAITSLTTLLLTLLTKNFIEKKLLVFKLNTEHKFEQRKQIKNVLATNKSHLLNACENLSHRLWNFAKPEHYKWLEVNGDYGNPHYYFHSFTYRILAVNAWMYKIQNELIHLDTTIASKEDLEFIKFIRFYGRIFSDTAFFKGFPYDYSNQTDHIFKNNIDELHQCITKGSEILSFNEYLQKISTLCQDKLFVFYRFLDGVNDQENRLRWQWFQIFKILNLAFLNAYGYDYQQTSDDKMKIAINSPMRSKLYDNFIFLLTEHKLQKQKEVKRLMKLLKKK
ncbi:MAG TPA: hypothetical protein VK484_11260 [Ferruginibacter sp.]|nr:hypothetical protein [Ferruginibacter sp.]